MAEERESRKNPERAEICENLRKVFRPTQKTGEFFTAEILKDPQSCSLACKLFFHKNYSLVLGAGGFTNLSTHEPCFC